MHVIKVRNGLDAVKELAFKTIDGHPKQQAGYPWMVVDEEVDARRDGGMK